MSAALDRVYACFAARGEVKKAGKEFRCLCPAHPDKTPSLNFCTAGDGRVLVTCRAGCMVPAILAAVGLHTADLFDGDPPAKTPFADRIVKTYPYRDEDGKLLFETVRLRPKDFRQRRPDGDGWVWDIKGVRRVPYRLPELLAAPAAATFYAVEGERDADALADLGLVATTNPMGAGKWKHLDQVVVGRVFANRRVVILSDNDDAGRKHAAEVWAALEPMAAAVRVVELPGLPEKGDVSDWLAAGGTKEQLVALTTGPTPSANGHHANGHANGHTNGHAKNGAAAGSLPVLLARRFDDIETKAVDWLWYARIPRGAMTIWEGDPGLSKSTGTIDIAARLSTGRPMPLAVSALVEPMNVAFVASEDAAETTLKPRLEAAGADMTRCFIIDGVRVGGKDKLITFPDDLPMIEAFLTENRIGLFVVDPLFGHTSGLVDTHKDASVREMLNAVKLVAERTGAAIVALRHLNKAGGGNAMYRGGGSIAVVAAARSVLAVGAHPDRPDTNVLATVKLNLAKRPHSITDTVADRGGHPVIEWGEFVELTADDLAAAATAKGRGNGERGAQKGGAKEFIRDMLADGPVPASEAERRVVEAGFSESTVRRAKIALGVRSVRDGFGADGSWAWVLTGRP